MSWKAEVNTYSDSADTWTSNLLRFDTVEEATKYANDLFSRWTAVKHVRVVNSDDPVNYRWDAVNHRAENLAASPVPPVEPNRLKYGTLFKTHDGDEGVIRDNKLGVIRRVHIGEDFGSIYMDRVKCALVDGIWRPVVLSKAQQRLMRDIHKQGI